MAATRRLRTASPTFARIRSWKAICSRIRSHDTTSSRPICVTTCTIAALRRAMHGCRSRSEEHTSELQSHSDLVCRLLLEKKKKKKRKNTYIKSQKTPSTVG